MKLADVLLRGLRSAQPLASAVPEGTLYYVTDEAVTEQSIAAAWVTYSDAGTPSAAAIDQLTGDVTAGPGSGSQVATIGNDKIITAKILNGAVTYAKIQDVSAISKLLGRGAAAGAGDVEELTLGTNLTMAGTTLNAAGGGGGDFIKIAEQTPSGVNSIIFSSLGAYTHLELMWSARSDGAATNAGLRMTFNGDTGANYDVQFIYGGGTTIAANEGLAVAYAGIAQVPAGTAVANMAGTGVLRLFDYRNTVFQKSGIVNENLRRGTTSGTQFTTQTSFGWRNAAAITSITLTLSLGNFIAGSKFSLYGIN